MVVVVRVVVVVVVVVVDSRMVVVAVVGSVGDPHVHCNVYYRANCVPDAYTNVLYTDD